MKVERLPDSGEPFLGETDMQNFLEKEEILLTSKLDFQGKLKTAGLFDLFMDSAAEHAEYLGVGYQDMMAHRAFWLAVRTKIRIYKTPGLQDHVKVKTWPGKPAMVKCDRFFRLTMADGELLAEGRTEWAAQDVDTGKILKTDAFGYPLDLAPLPERVCDGPFTRFRERPDPENMLTTYTVGSRDIDTGRHMNNVAYIRMLMGTFTVAQLADMDIAEVEVSYNAACMEEETLSVYRRQDGEGWHFLVQKPDGAAAVQMAVRLR